MKTICLCMIVRNEAHVITRALSSVLGIIDHWIVCDTGSTDATIPLVLQTLGGIPGELHSHEWVNFGHNRSLAIALARDKADYTLIIDADMIANVRGEFKSKLSADAYSIRYEGSLDYSQQMLVSNRHEWRFVGVTHEYISSPTALTSSLLPELTLIHHGDGANRSDKFGRDIRLLTEALDAEPDNPRSQFYLAESYRNLGHPEEALGWYRKRASNVAGWDEETWFATYQAARMRMALGHEWDEVLPELLRAYALRPSRLEPLYDIVRHHQARDEFTLGYLYFARALAGFDYPADRLFIDRTVYDYGLMLEGALCALGSGHYAEAVAAINRAFDAEAMPDWAAEMALQTRRAALDAQAGPLRVVTNENRIVVLVAFHNPGHYLDNCVESLLAQDYGNFAVLLLDDASDDDSHRKLPRDDPRFRIVRSRQRRGAGWNQHRALTRFCAPEEIVVYLDGDDWLACEDALSQVNQLYNRHDCWVAYGQSRSVFGELGTAQPIPTREAFAQLREGWDVSHLRTHRAGLYQRIAEQDPTYECMKDAAGEWLTSAVDAAVMFAVMELAGFDRVVYNDTILHVYNSDNPSSWHHSGRDAQRASFRTVQSQRPFRRVESYRPAVEARPRTALKEPA